MNASRDMSSILAIKEREISRLRALLTQYAGTGSDMLKMVRRARMQGAGCMKQGRPQPHAQAQCWCP